MNSSAKSNCLCRNNKLRTKFGAHLIELLAAILIAGLLAVVLSSSLSEVIRLNTESNMNLLAITAAQEVIERVRSTPYDEVPIAGDYEVQVNLGGSESSTASPTGGAITQKPTMLDGTKLVWLASSSGDLPANRFKGRIKLSLSELSIPNTKRLLVTAIWNISGVTKQYQTGTVITKNGIVRHSL